MFSFIQLSNLPTYFEQMAAASIRGLLVLAVAAALCYALRRAKAATRHLAWSAALISLIVLPALSLGLPAWQIAVLPAASNESRAESPALKAAARAEATAPTKKVSSGVVIPDEKPARSIKESAAKESHSSSPQANSLAVESLINEDKFNADDKSVAGAVAGTIASASVDWARLALLIWLAGAMLVAVRLIAGSVSVVRMRRQANEIKDTDLIALASRVALRLGLRRRVKLLANGRVTMPVTCGLFRSAVLLPAGWDEWTDERREVVLLHELAHVKRWDCLTQMLAMIACAVYWFNPLVWLAARRHRIEREVACDDLVLEAGTKASDYAGHLLDIARAFQPARASLLAAVAIARRSQLENRLLAILDSKRKTRRASRFASIAVALAIVCVALPLSAARLSAQADSKRSLENKPAATDSIINQSGAAEIDSIAEPAIDSMEQVEQRVEQAIEAELNEAAGEAAAEQIEEASGPSVSPIPVEQDERSAAIQALREALKDDDAEVREQALFALSQSRDPQAVDALIEALKDSHRQVRERAAWGLGLRGNQNSVEPLIGALRDAEWRVREQAAWALGLKGDRRAVEPLVATLSDENAQVREKAAWSLGLKGDSRAVEPLISALKDASPKVREQAAWALGLRGDQRAANALKELLNDENSSVRKQAGWALGMILIRRGDSSDDERDKDDEDEEDKIDGARFNGIAFNQAGSLRSGAGEGIKGRVANGVRGGVGTGIKGGVSGGVGAGVRGGIKGGVRGNVNSSVRGAVGSGVGSSNGKRTVKGDAEKKPR